MPGSLGDFDGAGGPSFGKRAPSSNPPANIMARTTAKMPPSSGEMYTEIQLREIIMMLEVGFPIVASDWDRWRVLMRPPSAPAAKTNTRVSGTPQAAWKNERKRRRTSATPM